MRLPSGYNQRLARYDRDLRVRYSQRRHIWLLERRARYPRLPVDPARYGFLEHDTVVQMRDGFFTLGEYPPRSLPPVDRLIAYLRTQDIRRQGDQDLGRLAEAVADELDAQDLAREEQAQRRAVVDIGDRAAELWEHNRWRTNVRVGGRLPRGVAAR